VADVTIVIPVLNGATHIEGAIRSVLEQDVEVQLIVVDGGSTDGTSEIVRAYGDSLTLLPGPDTGQSEAINRGLRMAKGTWFNWLGADDRLQQGALRKVLEAGTTADVVAGRCRHIDSAGRTLAVGGTVVQPTIEATMAHYSMGQPAHFYRTERILALNGTDPALHYCMDMDLWFRYLIQNELNNVIILDEELAVFAHHESSKTVAQKQQMRAERYAIWKSVALAGGMSDQLPELDERASSIALNYPLPDSFNGKLFIGNLAWHLLLEHYETGDAKSTGRLLPMVERAMEFGMIERFEWQLRRIKARITGTEKCQ
jgi:hypothetical protein